MRRGSKQSKQAWGGRALNSVHLRVAETCYFCSNECFKQAWPRHKPQQGQKRECANCVEIFNSDTGVADGITSFKLSGSS